MYANVSAISVLVPCGAEKRLVLADLIPDPTIPVTSAATDNCVFDTIWMSHTPPLPAIPTYHTYYVYIFFFISYTFQNDTHATPHWIIYSCNSIFIYNAFSPNNFFFVCDLFVHPFGFVFQICVIIYCVILPSGGSVCGLPLTLALCACILATWPYRAHYFILRRAISIGMGKIVYETYTQQACKWLF